MDCYLEFETHVEARAAQECNEFMLTDDLRCLRPGNICPGNIPFEHPWRVQLHQSCAFELQSSLEKFWVTDASHEEPRAEAPAASVRDQFPRLLPNFLDVYRLRSEVNNFE